MGKFVDLSGMVFNRLTVKGISHKNKRGAYLWDCICECGGSSKVLGGALKNGNTKSCGCLSSETTAKRSKTHGLSKTPEYSHWNDMLKRCFNKNSKRYENYALRGISVHEDFVKDFTKFLAEIGPKPLDGKRWSVGRIDNNDWYTYGNIRWETDEQQARNHTIQKNNKSGFTGVHVRSKFIRGVYYDSFVATWKTLDGKTRQKEFSNNKYGYEKARELAVEHRRKMIEKLQQDGAEYAQSHGTR